MKPSEFDRRYGELHQVVSAYTGMPADDSPDKPSQALQAYTRHTWHTRPWALGTAVEQLRAYAEHPPGRLRQRLGEFYPVPDIGLPDAELQGWFGLLADHIQAAVDEGQATAALAPPQTHWEWRARFPELAQLLGGWHSQDMPDEFPDHDAALDDYTAGTAPEVRARLVGEISELLALRLDEADLTAGLIELGCEVAPPPGHSFTTWLTETAATLEGPQYIP
jgi:hypothetical protein